MSGPYSDKDKNVVRKNIEIHKLTSVIVWSLGHTAFSPVLNTTNFEYLTLNTVYNDFLDFDIHILKNGKFDAILMLPCWEHSGGAIEEHRIAKKLDMRVFYSIEELAQIKENK